MTKEMILSLVGLNINNQKIIQDLELKLMKAERGNDTQVERIKSKDEIEEELKEIIEILKAKLTKKE